LEKYVHVHASPTVSSPRVASRTVDVVTIERDTDGWRCIKGSEESLHGTSFSWQLEVAEHDDDPECVDSLLQDYSVYLQDEWAVEGTEATEATSVLENELEAVKAELETAKQQLREKEKVLHATLYLADSQARAALKREEELEAKLETAQKRQRTTRTCE